MYRRGGQGAGVRGEREGRRGERRRKAGREGREAGREGREAGCGVHAFRDIKRFPTLNGSPEIPCCWSFSCC